MIYVFSYFDLVPYILLFLSLIFVYNIKNKGINKLYLMATILFVFSAIRYGTGWDYFSYMNEIKSNDIERYEFLCQLLMTFSRNNGIQLFFVVTSFLIIYPLAIGCKKMSRDPELSLIVYALIPQFYIYSLDVIRNAVAWSLVFCSYAYFREKKYLVSILLLLMALGFHISVVASIPIYILYFLKIGRKISIGIFLSSFVLTSLLSNYLLLLNFEDSAFKGASYYIGGEASGGGSMKWAMNMIGILFLLLWNRLSEVRGGNVKYLVLINVGVSLWNLFYEVHTSLASRFSVNYIIFMILIIPELLFCFKKRRFVLNCILFVSFAFCASSFYVNIAGNIKNNGKMAMFPYQTIFEHIDYSNLK